MKILQNTLLIALSLLMFTSLNAQNRKKDSRHSEEKRNVESFNKVSVSGGVDLYIEQGDAYEVVVIADENVINNLITEVKGDELKIYLKRNVRWMKKADVYITVKNLRSISASGGSDVESKGVLNFDKLSIASSGGSDIELELEVDELRVATSGGSDVDLDGSAHTLKLTASGGSDFDGYNFKTKEVIVTASGGSDSNVYASESITVNASGASDVNIKGNPQQTKLKSTGSSDIHTYK